jgi:hypothetical protein
VPDHGARQDQPHEPTFLPTCRHLRPNGTAEHMVCRLTNARSAGVATFGTEAGFFQAARISSVVAWAVKRNGREEGDGARGGIPVVA